MNIKRLFHWRWILTAGSSIVTYLPVVAGIIEPMIWPLLITSPLLYHLLYWWWEPLAQHFFPAWWFISGYIGRTRWINPFAPLLIVSGMAILVIGLAQIVHAKTRKTGLVTTGLFKYVRHPQHLGIAVMSFGFLMLNSIGIRVGDILAWTLVVLLYVLLADSEEQSLEKEFGEAYLSYKRKVPYMIPFLPSTYGRVPKLLPPQGFKRKLALIGVYIIVLAAIAWFLTLVPTYHTR